MQAVKRIDLSYALAEIAADIRRDLERPIELRALADRAGFSAYHFHRIFRAVFGEPLAAYIRRERLQRAAAALRSTDRDVTAIALEAGYESPSAFARAFAEHFGAAPMRFRGDRSLPIVPAHALPRFRGAAMDVRVAEIAPMRLLAVRRTGPYRTSAPAAFDALVATARRHDQIDAATRFVGLSYGSPEADDESSLVFDACFSSGAAPAGELFAIAHPGGRYAAYRHAGAYHFIEHVFDRLFDAAVFSGRFDLRDAPCLEIHLNDPRVTPPEELVTDVCIPIV